MDDPETTLKIYTHVTEKMKKDAGKKIKIHFADILGAIVLQEMRVFCELKYKRTPIRSPFILVLQGF
jgi:hypothetical protein